MHRIAAWRAAIGLVAVISSCEVCGHGNDLSSAAEGRTLYETNGCVSCHGLQGHGDGPVGKTLTPAPRDFRGAGVSVFPTRPAPCPCRPCPETHPFVSCSGRPSAADDRSFPWPHTSHEEITATRPIAARQAAMRCITI